ncbi:MAG TPA: 4-hydroxy-3-methylbut-2-enyl diphosphate reductase [Ignavibacteriaceae bacterium]|nr:4-hydroxy-3-methylbut-2-enyl diphosphate reductase [Ignavibacteriaceae bacterium]
MKKFNIPFYFKSSLISKIKQARRDNDPKKKDLSPSFLDFGPVRIFIARHFGFCYGVENAIEIAYRAIEENPGKRIFLLSEMIHNPRVNNDLKSRGVNFIMDTRGNQLVKWEELNSEDIAIIPAFGTTLEIQKKLNEIGIDPYKFNTTCPFVEKVWNRANQLGEQDYTVIIHGKYYHEETRATFSHSSVSGPSLIIRDLEEAEFLSSVILGDKNSSQFYSFFKDKFSIGFNPDEDLKKIGVVNQTTMLATETQMIAEHFKETMIKKYGIENLKDHFADTRDTLCYATNDNQDATSELLKLKADFAVIVGGYNSSNSGHIAELLSKKFKTYYISSAEKISRQKIYHFNVSSKKEECSVNYIPGKDHVDIILTSGASCPDAVVEEVLLKIISFFNNTRRIEEVIGQSIPAFN